MRARLRLVLAWTAPTIGLSCSPLSLPLSFRQLPPADPIHGAAAAVFATAAAASQLPLSSLWMRRLQDDPGWIPGTEVDAELLGLQRVRIGGEANLPVRQLIEAMRLDGQVRAQGPG